jgi:hypothetical protein
VEASGSGLLPQYMRGKASSNLRILQSHPSTSTLIKPSFIYGGEEFGLAPPRVTTQ